MAATPRMPATSGEISQDRSYGSISDNSAAVHTESQVRSASLSSAVSKPPRAVAPDLLRGLLMVLQALDHCAVALNTWKHGVALDMERDGAVVDTWNHTTAWVARMLTHLCAPGFFFLMGMGIVYFGRSRHNLGWTTRQMVWHFTARAIALTLVNQALIAPFLTRFWMVNMVLVGLAVDYLLAGLLWLAVNASEKLLSRLLTSHMTVKPYDEESRQLLNGGGHQETRVSSRSETISWHLHNLFLLTLTGVTIGWNKWLSPDGGRCPDDPTSSSGTSLGPAVDFWFYPVFTDRIMSGFPPLGWISFSIFGLLYGRLVLASKSTPSRINKGNTLGGILLLLVFAVTRLIQFGNLSENCLRMPEQLARPDTNQYLVSFRAFFYIIKYPPDLAYFAFTMGLNLFLLAFFGSLPVGYAKRIPALMVYGTSALFFYAVHILLYFALAAPLKKYFGRNLGYDDPIMGGPVVAVDNLLVYWITWAAGLAILYPLCLWYGRFKSTKGPNSIWRFF